MENRAKVTKRNILPPGGCWFYHDPDLDQYFEHYGMLDDFGVVVNRARKVNGLDPQEDVQDRVEEYICDRAPAGTCGGYVPTDTPKVLTISKVGNFTRTLVQTARLKLKGEEIYNPDPLAAAKICKECPLNKKHLCSSCTGLESLARRLLRASQTTPLDRVLGACSVCGCMLRVLVHMHPNIIRSVKSQKELEQYPDHCWVKNPELIGVKPNES